MFWITCLQLIPSEVISFLLKQTATVVSTIPSYCEVHSHFSETPRAQVTCSIWFQNMLRCRAKLCMKFYRCYWLKVGEDSEAVLISRRISLLKLRVYTNRAEWLNQIRHYWNSNVPGHILMLLATVQEKHCIRM